MSFGDKISELKGLLEAGFRIEQITYNFKDRTLTTTVNLVKGSVHKIVSTTDMSFFDYMEHFKKINDGYGNLIFVYVDEQEMNRRSANGLSDFNPIRNSHIVKVGARILDKDIVITLLQKPGPGIRSAKAHFFMKPSKNSEFRKIDARDPVTIHDIKTNQEVYKGYINSISHGKDIAHFECEVTPRSLTTEKLSAEFIQFLPFDTIYFVTKKCGVTLNLPPDVRVNLSERDFVVIVPTRDFLINDIFKFGGVEFYPIFDSKDDAIIRKSTTGQKEPDWGSNFPRARTIVRATNHFDAIQLGYAKINNTVNWITLRNDLTLPVINEKSEEQYVEFNIFKHYSRVRISSIVYCREINQERACLFDIRELIGNKLAIENDPNDYFKPTKSLFEPIMSKSKKDLSQQDKNLILSLHWLARSVNDSENVDKLLDLWTSIEFIVSFQSGIPLLTEEEKRLVFEKVADLGFSEEKLGILKDKIDMFNDVPLMQRFKVLVEKLDIDFTLNEWNLVRITRRKRNEIIHGLKENEIATEEIERLRGIVERILIAIANGLIL